MVRIRRTKEEIALGLTPEEALKKRTGNTVAAPLSTEESTGEIVIRIRPEPKVDKDYFEFLTNKPVEIVLDEKWFMWLDNKLSMVYNRDMKKFFSDVLEMGLAEVIDHKHFARDLK